MKIILLEDVRSLGRKGEIVEVKDGYGRNLVSKKKGKEATNKNLNDLKLKKANDERVAQQQLEAARELAVQISQKEVVVKMKVGEGGKTFGAVSTKEIAAAVKEQLDLDIDKKKMQLQEPIRALGYHVVKLKLHPQATAELKVKVEEK